MIGIVTVRNPPAYLDTRGIPSIYCTTKERTANPGRHTSDATAGFDILSATVVRELAYAWLLVRG